MQSVNIDFANIFADESAIYLDKMQLLWMLIDSHLEQFPGIPIIKRGIHSLKTEVIEIDLALSHSLLAIDRNKLKHKYSFNKKYNLVFQVIGEQIASGGTGAVFASDLIVKPYKDTVRIKQAPRIIKVTTSKSTIEPSVRRMMRIKEAESQRYYKFYETGCKKAVTYYTKYKNKLCKTTFYMVMQRFPGLTLGAYLKKHRSISLETALNLISKCFKVLSSFHEMFGGHGDIHFGNFIYDPESGNMRLIDFDRADSYIPPVNDLIAMKYMIQTMIKEYIIEKVSMQTFAKAFSKEFGMIEKAGGRSERVYRN